MPHKNWRDSPRSRPPQTYTEEQLVEEIERLEALKNEVQEELKLLKTELIARHGERPRKR